MTIILLNFLIALISQKYEEAMMKNEITKANHMADLNEEYFTDLDGRHQLRATIKRFFRLRFTSHPEKIGKGRIFILQMNEKND
jgi:hypothetical protein